MKKEEETKCFSFNIYLFKSLFEYMLIYLVLCSVFSYILMNGEIFFIYIT